MKDKKLVVLMDGVSRTIAGYLSSETETTITVENPVIVNAVPQQGGQMSLQLIPVFFREILEDKNQTLEFTYDKTAVIISNITALEPEIMTQYDALFTEYIQVPEEAVEAVEGESKVIDLFEGKK